MESGLRGGRGRWFLQPGRGTAAPEGQEARPAPRARGKLLSSEAAAAATKSAGRRGGGRCRVEAARQSRAFSPDSPDKSVPPPRRARVPAAIAVSVAAVTKARRRGISGCYNGSDPKVAFLARLRSRLSRKNPQMCAVSPGHEHSQPPRVR